jgi:hypothetical protein
MKGYIAGGKVGMFGSPKVFSRQELQMVADLLLDPEYGPVWSH